VVNPEHNAGLDARKKQLEAALRARWRDKTARRWAALPTMQAYGDYYARFRKTYHVLLQLESVALKGRSLPGVLPLSRPCSMPN